MQTIFFDWTEERVAKLTEMWLAGYSASQCAAEFCVTRNAAMGKICRLKLPPRERVGDGIASRSVLPQSRQSVPFRVRSNGTSAVLRENVPDVERVDLPGEDIPAEQRKTLLELTSKTCRWPIGGKVTPATFFCGAYADLEKHRPYCRFHHRIAYQPVASRQRVYIPLRIERV